MFIPTTFYCYFSTIITLDMTPKNKPYQNSYDFSNIYSLSPTALASALHFKHIFCLTITE